MPPSHSSISFKKCQFNCPFQEFVTFPFHVFMPFIFHDILAVLGSLHGSINQEFPPASLLEVRSHFEDLVITNTWFIKCFIYSIYILHNIWILSYIYDTKGQMKLAWICSQTYTPLSPNHDKFFFFSFMQFQIILWEFNCKSNKNIKSYHMLYENIVSDSIYVSKEIL